MLEKMLKIVGVTALIAGLVVFNFGLVQAVQEATAGSGPESAIAPTVGWTSLEPGTSHWYTFNYDYVDVDEADDNTPEEMIAALEMATAGGVEFVVQTMDRLGPWLDADDDPGVLGRGSPLFIGNDDDGDGVYSAHRLAWVSSARASGDYLIIVTGEGDYQLTVDGETVSFTQPALDAALAFVGAAPANMIQDEAMAAAPATGTENAAIQTETFALGIDPGPVAVQVAGSSPENAIAPTVGWTEVQPGTSHWYTFDYDYVDVDEEVNNAPEKMVAALEMATAGGVEFVVQTMDRLGPWLDEDDDPGVLGRGSPLFLGKDDDGDSVYSAHELAWENSARASGSYYIIVTGEGAYRLNVEGETVNFTQSALDGAFAFAGAASPSAAPAVAAAPAATEVQSEEFALTIEPAADMIAKAVGHSPESALAPTVGWVTVKPGESHWYSFNYDYVDVDEASDNSPKQAIATLEMVNADSVDFVVQTMERLGPWHDKDDDPGVLGRGSPLYLGQDDDSDSVFSVDKLAWAGSARASGTYYIIVEGDGAYRLTVEGDTVHFSDSALDAVSMFAMTVK